MSTNTPATAKPLVEVLLVNDHLMFREHLRDLVGREGRLRVCGEADSAESALELIRRVKPHLAIIDDSLRGSTGLDLVKQFKEEAPDVRVLVLSMHDWAMHGEQALRAGACGYLTKSQPSCEVLVAIHRILEGETYRGGQIVQESPLATSEIADSKQPTVANLAARELEVFTLLGQGKSTSEIAAALEIGSSTVETYRSRIRGKLGLRNAAHLYAFAGNWLRAQGN